MKAQVAEWSKAIGSSPILERGVGSNPTLCIKYKIYLILINIFYIITLVYLTNKILI